MEIETAAAAFVLGRGGSTKRKIERVSETRMDLDERRGTIEIRGTPEQRQKARDYVNFVDMQRRGSVEVDAETRSDITVVAVPEDCCGFVMGRGGNTLRSMEEEWGTLMCFAKVDGREQLCIFGKFANRRGAELKVMSALEHKKPGHCVDREELLFTKRVVNDTDDEGWAVDTKMLHDDDFSYALGAKGSTRRKLAKASGKSNSRCRHALHCSSAFSLRRVNDCVNVLALQAALSSTSVAWRAWPATARSAFAPRSTFSGCSTNASATSRWTTRKLVMCDPTASYSLNFSCSFCSSCRTTARLSTPSRSIMLLLATVCNHSDAPQDHTPLTMLTKRNRARNHDIVSSSPWPSLDPVLNKATTYMCTCLSSQDVEIMNLPSRSVGFITGHKGEGLRTIEGRTGTFIFTNASDRSGETEEVRLSPQSALARISRGCFQVRPFELIATAFGRGSSAPDLRRRSARSRSSDAHCRRPPGRPQPHGPRRRWWRVRWRRRWARPLRRPWAWRLRRRWRLRWRARRWTRPRPRPWPRWRPSRRLPPPLAQPAPPPELLAVSVSLPRP